MSVYNLDDKKFIWEFSITKNVSRLLKVGEFVLLKHYSVPGYNECRIIAVEGGNMKVRFKEAPCNPDVKRHDPVVINFSSKKRLFVAGGEVSSVELLKEPVIGIKVNKVVKRDNLRKNERYCVSLEAAVKHTSCPGEIPATVKDISLGGVKINAVREMDSGEVIHISVNIDKDNKVGFRGRIVRKISLKSCYEYGVEISEITENNLLLLRDFINSLKDEA